MRVLITGATGAIGHEVLGELLQHPAFTSVTALSRRDIPSSTLPNSSKFKNVIVKDFGNWSQDIMDEIWDAEGIIWAMGTNTVELGPNHDWPLAFQAAMFKEREERGCTGRFRYVALSGKWVEQDQEVGLCFLDDVRKMKGRYEIALLEFAKANPKRWQTHILKPAGVIVPRTTTCEFGKCVLTVLMGSWGIRSEELAAYIADLLAGGAKEAEVVLNERLVERGRMLLGMKGELGSKLE